MKERIGTYCSVISGYAFKSKDLITGSDIPVIKIGNISNGNGVIFDNSIQYVDEEFLSIAEKYHVHQGDILISLTGSHLNQPNSMVGRSCRNRDNILFLLNQRAGKIIPNENVDPDFLYYFFQLNDIQYAIAVRAYGAANQVNVSPKDIMNIKVEIPILSTQKKIAQFLLPYDNLIDNNDKRIKTLEKNAENLYKEWFVRFRFPSHEQYKYKVQSPKGWKVGNSNEEHLIPEIFHYGELNELGEFVKGKNITISEAAGGDIPVISAGIEPSCYHDQANVLGDSLTVSASGANAGYLRYHLSDIWAADCSYYQKDENIWFIYNALRYLQPVINNLQCGSAQPHVYPKNLNRLCILIPTRDLIIKYNDLVSPYYKEIYTLQKRNQLLKEERDKLLPRLMSGKLEL